MALGVNLDNIPAKTLANLLLQAFAGMRAMSSVLYNKRFYLPVEDQRQIEKMAKAIEKINFEMRT